MNDLEAIKEEIYNCGLVVPLLESLNCEINHSTSTNERVEARRPDGSNPRSVQVKLNENLSSTVRSKPHIPIGDIYDLVSYIKFGKETKEEFKNNLHKSKRYIVKTLGLKGFNVRNNSRDDPNEWLKELQKKKKKRFDLSRIEPNNVLSEDVFRGLVMKPYYDWVKEGILPSVQNEFKIGFDIQSERVTIPIFNKDGMLVGVKGRATRREDEERYKYMAIYNFSKSKELFNLHKAKPYIRKKNEIILVEAEKSTMKAWQYSYKNVASQMGSEITKIQAETIKRMFPDCKIILAYDKDKTPSEVKEMAKVFGEYNNLYAIVDIDNLLEEKDAPLDRGVEIWEKLYNKYCFKVFPNK